ncbi:hypothetical protein EO95_06730 [Methanosarcina sp. 1.H.T.1A.1]|nr:type II toxin-antitoxin system death-on-curing family toxin [Methanosarcina sp. 1.H.T.1A.1]KKH99527.1 hypothetical protein EO95_06730 [Methanosarcina sp. 1.H.T.1A.1]
MQTIAGQHPFVNGNKRTGIATAIMILRNEGYRLTVDDNNDFIVAVATPEKNLSVEHIVDWVRENSVFEVIRELQSMNKKL